MVTREEDWETYLLFFFLTLNCICLDFPFEMRIQINKFFHLSLCSLASLEADAEVEFEAIFICSSKDSVCGIAIEIVAIT